MEASRRLAVLLQQVTMQDGPEQGQYSRAQEGSITRQPCRAAEQVVDSHVMEVFMDANRTVKEDVYKALLQRPELLAQHIEGLSKESHRELVRNSLKCILEAGYEPMRLFDSDIERYIYMAEICAPVDLSLVRWPPSALVARKHSSKPSLMFCPAVTSVKCVANGANHSSRKC